VVPSDPRSLLRGLLKLVAVVAVAGVVGAGVGVGLAELSGDDAETASVAVAPATESAPETTATAEPTRTAAPQTTATAADPIPPAPKFQIPLIEVLSAEFSTPSSGSGSATVTARVRVTNRNAQPFESDPPLLLAGGDRVPLDAAARSSAAELLRPVAANASAIGELRFALPSKVADRLTASPRAQLALARRTVDLELTQESR
jgi:hypothetical protein